MLTEWSREHPKTMLVGIALMTAVIIFLVVMLVIALRRKEKMMQPDYDHIPSVENCSTPVYCVKPQPKVVYPDNDLFDRCPKIEKSSSQRPQPSEEGEEVKEGYLPSCEAGNGYVDPRAGAEASGLIMAQGLSDTDIRVIGEKYRQFLR